MNPISDIIYAQQSTTVSSSQKERSARVENSRATASQEGEPDATARSAESQPVRPVNDAALQAAIEKINQKASGLSPALKFEPNTETGVVVITVLNRVTGEVIRQLPPEAVVKAAADGGDDLPALVKLRV